MYAASFCRACRKVGAITLVLIGIFAATLATPMAVDALPPRPTPIVTPTVTPTPAPAPKPAHAAIPPLSHIRLSVTPLLQPVYWSVVEWQGGDGVWQRVEGWQGTVVAGRQRWAVLERNFGEGPFRWVVYAAPGSAPLAASAPFTLPAAPNQELTIPITIPTP